MQRVAVDRKLLGRFLKWSAVGVSGAVVDYGILIALVELARFNPLIIYVGAVTLTIRWIFLAQAISFTCAVINNYILNRHWTFGDIKHKGPKVQFVQFFIVSVVGLGTRTAIFWFLFELMDLWYIMATAIAIIVVLIWNFFANLAWTFREAE